ncbi:MAG: hypothetical protein H7Y33_02445 [Cytophagales bacterium]|nr:hypothetical protein [Rhizobacter sp.]
MASPRSRRITPLRTVALESLADLQAFRSALAKRFTLPHVRIALRLSELPEAQLSIHEREINRLLGARAYAESALAALVLVGLSAAFPLQPAGAETAAAIGAWVAQALLGLMVGGLAGRLAGLWLARRRLQRLCAQIEAEAFPG